MEKLASALNGLGLTTQSSPSGAPSASSPSEAAAPAQRRWAEPVACPGCGSDDVEPPHWRHRCCVCRDGGRIRRGYPIGHPLFGRSEPCPACAGAAAMAAAGAPPPASPEERMRIPARYRSVTFDQWLPANGTPRVRCQSYAASWPPERPLLFLTGEKGTGKTHLACAILRAAWERHGVRGQFWPVIDLLDRLRRASDPDRATETVDDVQEQLLRVPLLVLDDLGAHRGTEWAEERLFALIDARYRDGLPLVVTSNVGLLDVAPRVRSRLADAQVSTVVPFAGPDRRMGAPRDAA
nr:ATP-binding protein [Tepidiforma sp.]